MEDDRAMANVRVDGAPAEATLGDGELRWRRGAAGGAERALSLEREVLGVQVTGKEVVVRAFVAAAAATGAGGKRCRRDFVLQMADGEGAAVAWGERLTRCLDSFGRPKRLFVFVNPFGGKKCAKKIYDTEIKPLFEAAGVSITLQETEYQGHAREVASSLDLAEYDGVVCVSGDGVLVEFSDGYMDAVILRDCPKADLLALLLKMSDGSYVKSPYVTYLKVRSFKLSPGQLVENPKRGGIIDVDGEVIARGKGTYGKNEHQDVMAYGHPIQLTVHQALGTIYCPDKIR